jgi:hypothetical protein
MVGWLIDDELEEKDRGIIEVLPRHFPVDSDEIHEKLAGVPAKIRTEHIPNKSLDQSDRYR